VVENSTVNIILYGIGEIGGRVAKLLLKKENVKIVGAIDVDKRKVGKDIGAVLGLERSIGIVVSKDEAVLSKVEADIVVHTTTSFLKTAYPQITKIVKHGLNVISTCEELSYPYVSDVDLASNLDRLATRNNVTILGTGVNPGFLMDTLPIVLTCICQDVREINIERVINAATRRLSFQRKIGAGMTVDEFKEKMAKKIITGHVGLGQSIGMVADALGWKLEKIEVNMVEPVVAEETIESDSLWVKHGQVAGIRQCAHGIKNGKSVITLDFQAHIGAKQEYDSITIKGTPYINNKIVPCVNGDIATAAIVVNLIPRVINSSSGLKIMKDLIISPN